MTDLLELAAKVERCREGGAFSLDTEIAYALNMPLDGLAKPYTASCDAAMTLVPEGFSMQVSANPASAYATVVDPLMEDETDLACLHAGEGKTPALALVAAALRARTHGGGEG